MAVSSTFISSDGDGYELQMGRWSRRLAPLFIQFAGVRSGERVLDVGCGTGHLAFALAHNAQVGSVRGLDFSTDFWTPNASKDGPVADYLGTLSVEAKARFRDAVELAYLDGEPDGARSYAATAWVVRGKVPA